MSGIFDVLRNPMAWDWGLIGGILGIGGILYAIISNRRNRREKEPCWAVQSYFLVSRSRAAIPDLEVSFQGRSVATLTISEILLWNNGRATINGTDIAAANPLRIVPVGSSEILAASVIATNSQSQPKIELTPNGAVVGFDYLDYAQGIVFRVVHTGTRAQSPRLVGDIKGALPLRKIEYLLRDLVQPPRVPLSWRERVHKMLENKILLITYILVFGVPVIGSFYISQNKTSVLTFWAIMLGSVGALVLVSRFFGSRTPAQPTGFLAFEDPDTNLEPNAALRDTLEGVASAATPRS